MENQTKEIEQVEWKPGIHKGVSEEVYHETFPGVSHHDLLSFEISPAHLVYAKATHSEQTDAMKLGSALHCALLEPERFAEKYVGLPEDYDGRKKMGIALKQGLLEQGFKEENILKHNDMLTIHSIRASIFQDKVVRALFDNNDGTEITLFWQDKETGIFCRGRVDLIATKYGVGLDLKSAQRGEARSSRFTREIETRLYYRQAAHYLDGMRALGLDVNKFLFLVVEKVGPFAHRVFELSQDFLAIGRAENRSLLNAYAECLDADKWPAYPDTIEMISPSPYLQNKVTA
jgi:exodeoxyribonuclease VIII